MPGQSVHVTVAGCDNAASCEAGQVQSMAVNGRQFMLVAGTGTSEVSCHQAGSLLNEGNVLVKCEAVPME